MDVWSFGVLLYTMCCGESLFKVNRDDDIKDGDVLRQLHGWRDYDTETNLERNIHDVVAKDLLGNILQSEPSQRSSMNQILNHKFFHPEKDATVSVALENAGNQFRNLVQAEAKATRVLVEEKANETQQKLQEGNAAITKTLDQIRESQEATAKMLKSLIDDRTLPRCIIPLSQGGASILYVKNVTIHCVCPITMEIPSNINGELIGYKVKIAKEWVKTYGPAFLVSLKVLQIGLTAYLGVELPLPSLRGLEQKLLDDTKFKDMMGTMMEEMEDDSLSASSPRKDFAIF